MRTEEIMNKNMMGLLLTAISGLILLLWGIHGIVNRKKINNRADYILAVGQFIGGVMLWSFLIYVFFKTMF